jgi:hypothetical protein
MGQMFVRGVIASCSRWFQNDRNGRHASPLFQMAECVRQMASRGAVCVGLVAKGEVCFEL